MPQYLAPGVYVEEVPSSVQPIAGVGTSTAGFIGEVADGVTMPPQPGRFVSDSLGKPVRDSLGNLTPIPYTVADAGVPQLITSWESFKNHFGDFQSDNRILAHAVYGFFNNGGTRCWVIRTTVPPVAANTTAVTDALAAFEAIDEIALVAVPGATDSDVQSAVITHCEKMADRFAILDGQVTGTFTADGIQGDTGNSNYAALYFPQIEVFDPVDNARAFIPPSGHIAGIYARVDTERGVHKAPANAVVRGALGLEHRLSRADQEGLNPAGINLIRDLNGNLVVWGARTLGGDANGEWKYINVRRLFLFLRESIDEGTQWVVFEPNDTSLWAKISRNVTAFLTNVWRSGALFGTTPAEAFYVRCDASTNPPEVRDLGQVVTEIGVAVVRPAEFVIFRISQWAGPGQ
ncbi:MAG TPA: phage tail sheath subtilisin-like domain-containing protein [Thermoanaerobaculia bacterium]|nr:phage tail sheath subtilisin-like domain-containing protein [Thermoanaerobaculia bacterium]